MGAGEIKSTMRLPGRKPGDGNGLADVVAGAKTTAAALFIPMHRISIKSGHNPRASYTLEDAFSRESLEELTNSIRTYGVLQPIIVQKHEDGNYSLIAGERRYHAAQYAELRHIPAIELQSGKDPEATALIENGQHLPLHPIDEALAVYSHLGNVLGCSAEDIPAMIVSVRKTGKDPRGLQEHLKGLVGTRGRSLSTWGQHKAGVLKMTGDEIRAVRTRQIALKPAMVLSRLPTDHAERATLLQEAIDQQLSAEQLSARIKTILGRKTTKPPIQVQMTALSQQVKTFDALSPARQAAVLSLLAQLQEALKTTP